MTSRELESYLKSEGFRVVPPDRLVRNAITVRWISTDWDLQSGMKVKTFEILAAVTNEQELENLFERILDSLLKLGIMIVSAESSAEEGGGALRVTFKEV